MNIDTSRISLAESSQVMLINKRCKMTMALRSMSGSPFLFFHDQEYGSVAYPVPPTLRDLVQTVLRRRSASYEYVAERFGVIMMEYEELQTFAQAMSAIEFG